MLYINGPYFVNDDLTLRRNLGTWNRIYGMLFVEQPIGVGFSQAGGCQLVRCGATLIHVAQGWAYRKRVRWVAWWMVV